MNKKSKSAVSFKPKNSKPVFAKKSFGQNFLIDAQIVGEIVAELDLQANEPVVEIGAGRGALTRELVKTGANVVAVELDKDLIPLLKAEFADKPNFALIEADALKLDFAEIAKDKGQRTKDKLKLAANLPYYISTAILQRLIEQRAQFSTLVLMLQREVVERICAAPGTSERGFLTILVEAYARVEKLFDVPPTAFRPAPKVWSSVIKVDFDKSNLLTDSAENENLLWQIVSACFLQKRKTILNNLKNAPPNLRERIERISADRILEFAEIEPARRPETLTLNEWTRLAAVISQK